MIKVRVGNKEASRSGELYFSAYQKLMRQRARIDKEIFKVQSKLLKDISKKGHSNSGGRKKYVPRQNNTTILAKAIRESMVPEEKMIMVDILESLQSRSLYHTSSKYFYTMVNNKLNKDNKIKKVSRGVFVYCHKKTTQKEKETAVA